ncbi:MAG: S49 family peptidase [Chitinophagaceae bacterium]
MNFRTASNIFSKSWLIESQAGLRCLELLQDMKNGKDVFSWKDEEDEENPESIFQKLFANADVITAPLDVYEARNHPGYEGKTIGILPVVGPMMKEDFCGWFGTASLRNELAKMKSSQSIKAVIMYMDSPGGTVDGTESLANDYADAGKTRETITVIDGMMCSAGYWAGSGGGKIVASNKTDIIGSIGTMIAFYDRSQYYEEMGLVLREYYATKSKDKNKDFRDARDGDGKLIIETTLNPMNDVFLSAVKVNRGDKLNEKETLTGKTFLAERSLELGLIDEISSMDTVIGTLVQKHKINSLVMSNKWTKLKAFFTFKADEKIEMKDEHLDKVETLVAEHETLTGKVVELETAATADKEKITGLEAQVQTLTTEKTTAEGKIVTLTAEVERLGKLDAGKISTPAAANDRQPDAGGAIELSASQKELNEKIKDF